MTNIKLLHTLAKDELIEIIRTRCIFSLSDREVYLIRAAAMSKKALSMMDEAIAEMNASAGDHKKHEKAHNKFTRANNLYNRADRLFRTKIEQLKKT